MGRAIVRGLLRPLLPEADSFSWMVVRPYGVGKLKLAPFLVFDRKLRKLTFTIPVSG